MNFEDLKKNLIDVLKEFQAKIGYAKNEMRLYYPLESLNRLLETELDAKGMTEALRSFSEQTTDIFCGVKISRSGERFCIAIPEDGVEQVHKTIPDSEFLKAFLDKISSGPQRIEELLEVFTRYSENVRLEKINSDEFDYVLYFADGDPDAYRYCIKFEECHTTYHRFTPKDYDALE